MTGLLELVEDLIRGPFDSRPDAASHARAVQARAFEGAAE